MPNRRIKSRRFFRSGGVATKVIVAAAGLAVVAGGVWYGLPRLRAPESGGKVRQVAETTADRASARKLSFEIAVTANGELEAKNKQEYRNPLDQESTIVKITPEGTRVKAGDLLIQLNVEEIQLKADEEKLKVESARAERVAAENNVEIQKNENQSKLRQSNLKLALAELALDQWRDGDVQKKRNELRLDADRAILELERLSQLYRRSQELNKEGFLSKDQLDKDEVLYIEAIAKYKTSLLADGVYESFEYRKDEKKYLSDVEEARAEIARVLLNNSSELANKQADLENRKQQLQGLENKLAKLLKQRDDATILARKDGLVVFATTLDRGMRMGGGGGDGPLQIGTQVYPNQLLIVLPDTTEMMAALRVQESLSGKVRPGQTVSVKVDAAGGATFQGVVDSIGVMAETGGWRDPNLREYTVRVALDTRGENLKPAMRCEGRIVLDTVPETLTVPVQAVFNEGPVQYVYMTRGQKFTRVPVKLGRRSDAVAEIVKGLEFGDTVLIREPSSGEILAEPWDKETLVAVGYKLGEDGKVVAEGNQMRGGPPGGGAPSGAPKSAGQGGRQGGGKGRPGGQGGEGKPDAAKPDAGKPDVAKPDVVKPATADTSASTSSQASADGKGETKKDVPGTKPAQ